MVSNVLLQMENTRIMVDLSGDSTLIDRVRIASGCLGSLRTLWGYSRTTSSNGGDFRGRGSLRDIVEGSADFVRDLAVFVLNCSSNVLHQATNNASDEDASSQGRIATVTLVSTAREYQPCQCFGVFNFYFLNHIFHSSQTIGDRSHLGAESGCL